jgi:VWFA-related protein
MRAKGILILLLAFLGFVCAPHLSAQTPPPTRQRPKLKDFGQSLKRLKWDPKAGTLVSEPKPTNKIESDLDVVRIDTDLVMSNFLVLDAQGSIVKGLTQSDFIITEDDEVQDINVFALGDSQTVPRSIVLIIDYSGSQFPYLKTSIAAAKLLVDKLGPLDSMAIVTDDVELILDFTTDKVELKKKLDALLKNAKFGKKLFFFKPGKFGRSWQYSALMATLHEAFSEEDTRPIVIFQTDGDEIGKLRNSNPWDYFEPPKLPPNLSKKDEEELKKQILADYEQHREFSIDDIYRTVEESRATIYTVIPGLKFLDLNPDEQKEQMLRSWEIVTTAWSSNSPNPSRTKASIERRRREMSDEQLLAGATRAYKMQDALAKISPLSGGLTAFLESPDQAEAIYSRILADMNQRYVVGYYPKNKERDGKRRRVKIEVRSHTDYSVVGRKAYYAPKSN